MTHVNERDTVLQKLLCIHGSFLSFLGRGCTRILRAPSWAKINVCHCNRRYSKWLEVVSLSAATSTVTIEHLRSMFATHGLPKVLVTDNGSQFTSAEFNAFLKGNGIQHVCSSPYHPSSNGLAERAVQCFKEGLKRSPSGDSLKNRLAKFLFCYCLTPHSTTGVSPAELLLGRIP